MNEQRRLILGVSLGLNVLLLGVVVFLWLRPAATTTTTVAQVTLSPPPGGTAVSPTPTEPAPTAVVVTVVATVVVSATPEPTTPPEPTAVLEPTATPQPTETPTPEPPTPTPESPTPAPTETAVVLTGPTWLRYANQFRLQANLPLLTENAAWSEGSANHSIYMILNSEASHKESVNEFGYSPNGAQAGENGNIAISGSAGVGYTWPMDYWMSAGFHALPILDPQLQQVGYGVYRDASSDFGLAATMDVKRGVRALPENIEFPILFPKDGGQTWVTSYTLPEFPNTISGCQGYTQPTGAPIIVQIGSGDQTPRVSSTEIRRGNTPVNHCAFSETTYSNNTPFWQEIGRRILDERDAIILVPRSPLEVGQTYTVTVVTNGQEITWQFEVIAAPPAE